MKCVCECVRGCACMSAGERACVREGSRGSEGKRGRQERRGREIKALLCTSQQLAIAVKCSW